MPLFVKIIHLIYVILGYGQKETGVLFLALHYKAGSYG